MTALELAAADWTLVERAQAGDMDAFADIYRNHYGRVQRFLHFRLGVDVDTSHDLAQDVFVRALRGINTVTWQGKAVEAWLLTIARNLAADHFKSSRMRTSSNRTIDDLITDRSEPVAADDPEAEAVHILDAELAHRLVAPLLPGLTRDQARVVHLRFFDDLSLAETAAVMGKQIGAVKASQSRACSAMRRALAGAS